MRCKMGLIVSTKRHSQEQVLVELLVNNSEIRQLRGEHNDIYVFSERTTNTPSRVSLRGKNDATKYFLIPKQLRKELVINGKVSCQRLQSDGRTIFVYVIDPVENNLSFLQT